MVQFGYRNGVDMYNMDDAIRFAERGGLNFKLDENGKVKYDGECEFPTPEEIGNFSPLGAVARRVREKYLGEESLEDCLERNRPDVARVKARDHMQPRIC